MNSCRVKAGLGLLLAVGLVVEPGVARAQGRGEADGTRTFGTSSVSHTIQAFAFDGDASDSANFRSNSFGSRWCTTLACFFNAAVRLPAGALVTMIELEACDTNFTGLVSATFYRIGAKESAKTLLATVSTGGVPGCDFFVKNLAVPHTIDNRNNTYLMFVDVFPNEPNGSNSPNTRFQAVRIFYNLQVSPTPATATFNDVPTSHPFFQFIQALAAAGITGGCNASPPLYCPDDPVTRGQMAVFISRALGLQFGP